MLSMYLLVLYVYTLQLLQSMLTQLFSFINILVITSLFNFYKRSLCLGIWEQFNLFSVGSSTDLYDGWRQSSYSNETRSTCVSRTTNLQYDLYLASEFGQNGDSWLEIKGEYGQRIMRTKPPSYSFTYRFSSYNPVSTTLLPTALLLYQLQESTTAKQTRIVFLTLLIV